MQEHEIFVDVADPFSLSKQRHKYMLICKDNKTKCLFPYPIMNKSDVYKKIRELNQLLVTQTGTGIRRLVSDNGLEFKNNTLDAFCN